MAEVSPENELRDYLHRELSLQVNANMPRGFFHYTTPQALSAILETGVIRASNLERVNDTSEVRFAASVFRANLDRRFAIEDDPDALHLLRIMRGRMREPLDISAAFALSFSSDGDETGMWNLYAERGEGFSFCINAADAIEWAYRGWQGWLWRCIYGEDELDHYCELALQRCRDVYLRAIRSQANFDVNSYALSFLDNVSYLGPIFKPGIWREEREWRWVFVRPEHRGQPYIELPLAGADGKQKPISAICAGPRCDYLRSVVPLQQLLVRRGYVDMPVHVSQHHVPIPGWLPPILANSGPLLLQNGTAALGDAKLDFVGSPLGLPQW